MKIERTVKFLDVMVRAVFVSTFIFTAAMGVMTWIKEWESVANTLVERWFTIMVGELIVMGFIQVVKEVVQAKMNQAEIEQKVKESENEY